MTENTIETKVNPLLARVVLPGETIRLPSGGLFYTNGELSDDVTNGEIHVYPMSAMDEIMMKSPDKLLSGDALGEVFKHCIPQILKAKELFSRDIDYIMLALRKATYGQTMDIKYTHSCANAKEHEYTADLSTFLRATKNIDPTTITELYKVTLPNGQVVKIHPVKFKDIIEIMQSANDDDGMAGLQERLFKSVVSVVYSVDETTDVAMITEWIKTIPAPWFNDISKAVEKSSDWGPNFEFKTKCLDCGEEVTVSIPLNPLVFFTQF